MNADELIRSWGFTGNPFGEPIAEREKNIPDLFFEPPAFNFNLILGDPDSPSSAIAFGYRGEGKSVLCEMVRTGLQDGPYLVVKYTNFSRWKEKDIPEITLDQHLDHVISLALAEFLGKAEHDIAILQSLSEADLAKLQWYVLRFSPSLEDRLLELFDHLPEKRRLRKLSKRGHRRIASFLRRKRYEIENIPNDGKGVGLIKSLILLISPGIPESRDLRDVTRIDLLAAFAEIIAIAGFKFIFVLVDRVDESEAVSSSPELVAQLIRPFLVSTNYLEMKKVATKFFLPTQIDTVLGHRIRKDRLRVQNIRWTDESLLSLLEKRLLTFSDGIIRSMRPFIEPSVWDGFESRLLQYSGQNPRNMIRLLDAIIQKHCERESDSGLIDSMAIEGGIAQFVHQRAGEADGEEYRLRLRESSMSPSPSASPSPEPEDDDLGEI